MESLRAGLCRVSRWYMPVARNWSKELRFAFNLVATAIVVDVTLFNGQRVSLEADLTASVQSMAKRAEQNLEFAAGDSSLHLAAFWMETRSWEKPSWKPAIV